MLMGNFAWCVYFSLQDIVDNYVDYLGRRFKFGALQNYLNSLYIPTTRHYLYSSASGI